MTTAMTYPEDYVTGLHHQIAALQQERDAAKQAEGHWWAEVQATRALLQQAEATTRWLREALEAAREDFTTCEEAGEYIARIDAALAGAEAPVTPDPSTCTHARTTCHDCGTTWAKGERQAR